MENKILNEINNLGLEVKEIALKNKDSFDAKLIEEINISSEWSNISDDILKSNLSVRYKISKKGKVKKIRLFLSGERITLKISGNGYLYGVIGDTYLPAPFVARLFDILLTNTVIKHTVKGGAFEYIPLKFNKTVLWLHYHIQSGKILYISNEEVVRNALIKISKAFLKDELDCKPIYLVANPSHDEIYDHNESGLGWIATNDLIERLEIVKEVIVEASTYTHVEVRQLLKEIKELLD